MDTRTKIVTAAEAAELVRQKRKQGIPVRLITGYFDPLLAAHSGRVAALAADGASLFAAVMEPPAPLLPARARAELAAGLRVVDYVVFQADDAFLRAFAPSEVCNEGPAHEALTRDLIAHVHSRHRSS